MDIYNIFLVGGGFFAGFLFTYIFTLVKFIFFDYLEWPYALVFASFIALSMGSSLTDGRFKWMYDNRSRVEQMAKVATAMIPKPDLSSAAFTVVDSNKAASLTYPRMGRNHILNIPYKPSNRRICNRIQIFLIRDKKEDIDVTHQPCVPYFCTALQLGGSGYKVIDKSTGEIITEYGDDVVPDLEQINKVLT